jgi:hypothetical protein
VATVDEIVHRFNRIPDNVRTRSNWMTGLPEDTLLWQVNDETYINGILLTVDLDYYMGYLIEVVDRTSGAVSFIAINEYHGHHPDGTIDHDSSVYKPNCGTFFARTEAASYQVVCTWAIEEIFGMVDSHDDAKRNSQP